MRCILVFVILMFSVVSGCRERSPDGTRSGRSQESKKIELGADVSEPENPLPSGRRTGSRNALEKAGLICSLLGEYPQPEDSKRSFEMAQIAPLCRPFVKTGRGGLDQCGDVARDPYVSLFTWPSRVEMERRGHLNLYSGEKGDRLRRHLLRRIDDIRRESADFCCGDDPTCQSAMREVEVSICQPSEDPNRPDPCVFGGSYRMPGAGYTALYRLLRGQQASRVKMRMNNAPAAHTDGGEKSGPRVLMELGELVERNLKGVRTTLGPDDRPPRLLRGQIVLSSYVDRRRGVEALEPVIRHEFGHACSMIRMQEGALGPDPARALRAVQWLDRAKRRCESDIDLSEAYLDFWSDLGESRGLGRCLQKLAELNQSGAIDKPCSNLCPGHYLEEAVGIAFSLLTGDVSGAPGAVFPNTCHHVRDGQHPLVSDVVDCLAQHSSRFRRRLRVTYQCFNASVPGTFSDAARGGPPDNAGAGPS